MEPIKHLSEKPITSSMIAFVSAIFLIHTVWAQYPEFKGVPAGVDFSHHLRDWDGFGFNYVQTAHTYDYDQYPQEYGGFSLLDEDEKQEIIDMVFGEDGLKIGLLKMFLDPLHQRESCGEFGHEKTTKYMLEFAEKGYAKTKERGAELSILTTLYGPPGWMTLQKFDQGRDLDPEMKDDLARYMIDWVKFLKNEKGLPVKYLSVHNEGDDWMRWPWDGNRKGIFDYNMFWPHEQINDFLKFMPKMLRKAGLEDVSVTNGEPLNWYAFSHWGHATNLCNDKEALANLGLITSHGFYAELDSKKWYGSHNSAGIDILRHKRPELHAWVTSTGWGKMDAQFVWQIHGNIYSSKVNGLIPWAGIQRPTQWEGGDSNPGNAFEVHEDSSYVVQKGYYFYKQISRAGQPGTAVAETYCMDSQTTVIAFSANGTKNADVFVIVNRDKRWNKQLALKIKGTAVTKFRGYRTDDRDENYKDIGSVELEDGVLYYRAPIGSVTTFFASQ